MRLTPKPGIVIHSKITWLLLFSIVSVAGASWLLFLREQNIERTNFGISQTSEIIDRLRQIITSVAESQSNTGSVSVPGGQPYTPDGQPYAEARSYLDSLQQLTAENKDQQQHIALLRQYLSNKRAPDDSLHTVPAATIGSLSSTQWCRRKKVCLPCAGMEMR